MTGKIKRRSLRCGGRPKADFGSIFTTFIAPALGVAGSVADSAISKAQVSKSNIKPAVKETNTEVTNNNTSVENLPTTQAPTKEPISGLITSNTVIPPDPTKTPAMRLGGRKKCWIGAAIMGATSIAGSLFGAAAQKREMRRQKNIQDWQNTTQEAANMTSTLNNSQDYQEDYLRQFRTAARLGKTLGAKGIYITDGGDATKIDNNTYLLRGGSHEDVNETGQTGIGINVGGNEVEAEGGEVAQKKNGALRIFSAQPILGNGMSPAQAILRGYNKDKVFSQQQAFKKRNGLKDDGSKAKWGIGWLDSLFGDNTPKKTVHFYKSQATGKVFKTRQEAIAENNKYKTDLGYRRNINREREVEATIRKQGNERIPYIKEKEIKLTNAGKLTGARLSTNQLDSIAKYASKVGLPIKTALGLVGQESAFGNYFGYANNAKDLNTYNTQPKEVRDKYGIPAYKIVNYENLIPERTPTNVDDFAINKRYGKRSVTGFGFSTITNGKELDRLKLQHEAYPALQRKRSKFWRDINTPTLQLAFEHYKTSPQTYNAGNPNQQNLVNNKANDVWGSPEIQEWYRTSPYVKHRLGGRCKLRNGGLTSKDRGSSKHPYPSVSSKDFAGGGRSYPIPTKADAVDALRLAGLHGRSDVKTKVYSRYPELRKKAKDGAEIEPYYDWARNTSANLGISFIDPTYDYRAYYDSVTPYERALIRFAPQGTHFTDIGKTPKHPTFSNESKYSNDKTPGGTWNGNVFVPSIWQFGDNGNNRRNKYMNNTEEGYFNGRVNVFPTSRKKHNLGGRMKYRIGGSWKAPVYNTNKYRVSNRMRRQIATWEGSDFAGQNAQFKGDAIGAKERELRQFMGKAYNYLNDNQRDALLSYYYNLVPKTFRGQMTKYRNALINAQTEQEYNDTLNNMRESINVGANRKGMRGLRNRRAIERNWFSYNYANPLQEKVDNNLTQVPDATKVVQPIIQQPVITKPIEVNPQEGYVPSDTPQGINIPQGRLYDYIKANSMKRRLRCGGRVSRPVKGMRPKAELGWLGYPYELPRDWDFSNIQLGSFKPSLLSKNYPYGRGQNDIARQLESTDNYRVFSAYRNQLPETHPYVQALTKATGHSWQDIKNNNYDLRFDGLNGYNHYTPPEKKNPYGIWGEPIKQGTWQVDDNIKVPYAPQDNITSKPIVSTPAKSAKPANQTPAYQIKENKLGMSPSTGDWIGLGIDTLAGLAGGIINYNAAKDMYIPGRAPIVMSSKLPTTYNVAPQIEEAKRMRDNLTRETYDNTSSSVAALNRANNVNLSALSEISKLWATKENEENKMLTQDALNQQQVAETNVRNQMARESEIAQYKNAQNQAKYDAINTSLTGLAQAYNNFYTNATKRYEDEVAMRTYLAGAENATPYRMLSMGVPMSQDALIGIYNQIGSINNPGPRPERKDYDSNASWSRAVDKWERDNTLYRQRGEYRNMVNSRLNKKSRLRLGIR